MGLRNWEAECRDRIWRDRCGLIEQRAAKALRILLGLSISGAAQLAKISPNWLRDYEQNRIDQAHWRHVSRRLDSVYKAMGGGWFDADLHEGAHCVYLVTGGADDRRAINAALALMGDYGRPGRRAVTIHALAKRVGIPAAKLRDALAGRAPLPPLLANKCFRQLGDHASGAGCYFQKADAGGWRLVGCDHRGCWW